MNEPFISHSEITGEIYIVCGTKKYNVTEQVIRAMRETGRLEQQRPHGECATCVHRSPYTYCNKLITHTKPDFFCGHYERREGEAE